MTEVREGMKVISEEIRKAIRKRSERDVEEGDGIKEKWTIREVE